MEDTRRVAIYSRKSRFTGKGESIGNQVELCREYVRNLFGATCAESCEIFEDEGFSGGDLNRPDFRRMMAAVRKKKFRAIVVYRLDRISRNISDFTGLIDELTKLDVSFISIREQFDTSTPMGRAMMFIISVFSQLERETIAERIRDNMHELAKTGRWLGGNAPLGFRSEPVSRVSIDGKIRKSFRLVSIPEEAETVKLIFDLYTRLDSLSAVEAEMLRRRIQTRQGKDFTRFAIRGILCNPVYMAADQDAFRYFTQREADVCFPGEAFDGTCGIMAYNRTEQKKGKTSVLLDVSRWIIAIGQHPWLVPSGQWIRVQQSLSRNKSCGYRKPRSNEALLTGLLFCTCGNRMYPKLSQRRTEDGKPVFSYVCKLKERSRGERCRCPNASGNLLDAAVMDGIRLLDEHRGSFIARLEKSRRFDTGSREPQAFQLSALQEEYEQNEKCITGLVDSLGMMQESAARSHVVKRMEKLTEENREIARRIQELQNLSAENSLNREAFDQLRKMFFSFSATMDNTHLEERRAAVRALVHRVTWDGENAHLDYHGADAGTKTLWGEDSK